MLGLQKALDTVHHEILCKKLKGFGVKNIAWLKSYLYQIENSMCNKKI